MSEIFRSSDLMMGHNKKHIVLACYDKYLQKEMQIICTFESAIFDDIYI